MNKDSQEMFDVFLCHAHVDAENVEALALRLEDEAGFRAWLDKWVLVPGNHWQQEMARGLDQAKTCAVCIGKSTPKGWFREEIQRALNRQTTDGRFRVIPVILPGGDRSLVDNFLELRTWVDFKEGLDDSTAFHLLTCGIRGVPPGRPRINTCPKASDLDPKITSVRVKLIRIRTLRLESLIDNDIALEYQRRILDQLFECEE